MKNAIVALLLFFAPMTYAGTKGLEKYIPQYSYVVIGADFSQLQGNDIFQSMEAKGQVWSYEDNDSDVANYFHMLNINPRKDVSAFVYSKYLNAYGSSGKLHVFSLSRDISETLKNKPGHTYLNHPLYRIDPDQDRYATLPAPSIVAIGNLNEVKMAIDLGGGKAGSISSNAALRGLMQKIPERSGVWGLALPLARRQAAAANAKQSTNPLLAGFRNYYFYAIPTKRNANAHFYGQTDDPKQASLVSAFMIGTLTVAKLKAEENLAEMLDQVNIEHNGNSVHVSAVINKEMVDAYFNGKLGVD